MRESPRLLAGLRAIDSSGPLAGRGPGELLTRMGNVDLAFLYKLSYMVVMQALSISEARANIKAVVDRVVADRVPVAITRQGREGVVMISESEWASIEETLYLLQSPANARMLMASIAELDAGKGEEHELIEP